jgi:GNAT superfamily N-acetyltransferase
MRIIQHDELPAELEAKAQMLQASAGWGPMDFARLNEERRRGFPAPDFYAVYAVEGKEILSKVEVLRLPYTMKNGERVTFTAIAGVLTRNDMVGKGLARTLLEEVHRRERMDGMNLSLLWTNKTNRAHRVYESLGYSDAYSPDLAIKRLGRQGGTKKPEGYETRQVTLEDSDLIERIHAESTRNRIGFCPRAKNVPGIYYKMDIAKPESFHIILRDGKEVGYFELHEETFGAKRSSEVVLKDSELTNDVISLIESEVEDSWLVLLNTFVRDSRKQLEKLGYSFTDHTYYVLMARPLDDKLAQDKFDTVKKLGTTDSKFVCHSLDYF